MTPTRILIGGIGNIFLGDDGFGCEVAARLAHRTWPEGVRVADFGIRGLDLAYALTDDYDAAVLIDAMSRGGAPGTVYVLEPDLGDLTGMAETDAPTAALIDAHSMDPLKVFALARTMGNEPKRVLLVGCEPLTLGPEEGLLGLSEPVAAAVNEAVIVIERLSTELQAGCRATA